MIDRDGYRPNVGIVLCNCKNEVFWGKRVREHSWQFPQGGIKPGERPQLAMYRELKEETGLVPDEFYKLSTLESFYVVKDETVWHCPGFVALVSRAARVVHSPATLNTPFDSFGSSILVAPGVPLMEQ